MLTETLSRVRSSLKSITTKRRIGKNAQSLCFANNADNAHELGPFCLWLNKSKSVVLRNVEKGEYHIVVSHQDSLIAKQRKSLIAQADVYDLVSVSAVADRVGFNKTSKHNGAFEYVGGGRLEKGICTQDFYLNIKKKTPYLLIYFKVLIDRYVNIDSCSISRVSGDIQLAPADQEHVDLAKMRAFVDKHEPLRQPCIVIYGDINPNVIDGSSIWLSSVISMLSRMKPVLVLTKDRIRIDTHVLKNVDANPNIVYLTPDQLGYRYPLSVASAVEVLHALDAYVPSITGIVTRGLHVAQELQKDNTYHGRHYVYLTDFYIIHQGKAIIPDDKEGLVSSVVSNADHLLLQTDQIATMLSNAYGQKVNYTLLPPSLPDGFTESLTNYTLGNTVTNIGYAGKIQPNWGIDELFLVAERLLASGRKIRLHIATSKISAGSSGDPDFVARINKMLERPYVTIYRNLNRFESMGLMQAADYIWCFRPASFEENTLELSTKLVESAALSKPCLCYPSAINRNFLGEDYPYFVKDPLEATEVLATAPADHNLERLAHEVVRDYSFAAVSKRLAGVMQGQPQELNTKLCVAGHDRKFVNPLISWLKKSGISVRVDDWEWGDFRDQNQSAKNMEWADAILCEWGLRNAVWFSNNLPEGKKLFIRIHAQEVREKARKFGASINIDNVERVIFVSNHIRKKALELWNWPESKTCVIPNYVIEKRAAPRDQLSLNIGLLGMIPKTKRLDRALDVLSALLDEGVDAYLHIKGHRAEDLPYMHAPGRIRELKYYNEQYTRIAQSPTIRDRVIFHPWGNDVDLWYKKIDFILSPSDNESFHYALADGVVAGCLPVVWPWESASTVYPNNWIVCDSDAAVSRIKELAGLSSKAIREMREKNKLYILDNYSSKSIFKKITSVLLEQEIGTKN